MLGGGVLGACNESRMRPMGRTTQESVLRCTGYIGICRDNMSLLWLGFLGQDGLVIVRHEKKDSA